jgi:maltose O-acetyltransferase
MLNHLKKIFESIIRNIGGALGRKLRFMYYKTQFKSCGSKVIIEEGVFFESPKDMSLGNNIWIDKNTILIAGAFRANGRQFYRKGIETISYGELRIGDNVHLAPNCVIQAHGGIQIGENVTIAAGSKLYTLSHHYKNLNDSLDHKRYVFSSMAAIEDQFLIIGNITVGKNAAIGLNSVVLPGSKIPNGTWIRVSSVIDGKEVFAENSVVSTK